jgi:hypothetical protein
MLFTDPRADDHLTTQFRSAAADETPASDAAPDPMLLAARPELPDMRRRLPKAGQSAVAERVSQLASCATDGVAGRHGVLSNQSGAPLLRGRRSRCLLDPGKFRPPGSAEPG